MYKKFTLQLMMTSYLRDFLVRDSDIYGRSVGVKVFLVEWVYCATHRAAQGKDVLVSFTDQPFLIRS